jgi:hypothetical protein
MSVATKKLQGLGPPAPGLTTSMGMRAGDAATVSARTRGIAAFTISSSTVLTVA